LEGLGVTDLTTKGFGIYHFLFFIFDFQMRIAPEGKIPDKNGQSAAGG